MKSILRSSSFVDKTIIREFPEGFEIPELTERTLKSSSDLVKGETKELLLNGIRISIKKGSISPPLIVEVEHDFPFFKIHFELEGCMKYVPKNKKSPVVDIPGGHYNFFFIPKVDGTLRIDSHSRKTLEIIFTKDYLKRIFGNAYKGVNEDFVRALKSDTPFLMWGKSKTICPELHVIIEEIIECKIEGPIKKVYLESKVAEILTILFQRLKDRLNSPIQSIGREDYQKILNAEAIIKENIKNPPTILQLSLLTGINQFKLKRNFKLVFGTPIFSYLTAIRMKKAKKLIAEKGFTVAEAAYEIGYKNPQHFSAAFKRKYSFLPNKLKRQTRG